MHEMDEAIIYYEELIKENPNIKEAYLELADIYVHEQQPVKAAQLLEQAIKENPYYVHFYLHLAEVLEELEDYQKANLYLNQALLLDEEEDSVLTALAKNAFYQGEHCTILNESKMPIKANYFGWLLESIMKRKSSKRQPITMKWL